MSAARYKPTTSVLHILTGIPVGSDDGGLTDGSLTVPFEAVWQSRSDGSIVCTRSVHPHWFSFVLMGTVMLAIGPLVALYFLFADRPRQSPADLAIIATIGLALAAVMFSIPAWRRMKTRELIIRGNLLAIWLPNMPARLRRMVWHPLQDSMLRVHPLSLPNALWGGHVLALEVAEFRMLLAVARDRPAVEAYLSRLPEPVLERWNTEPGLALVVSKGNRHLGRRGTP